MKASTGTLLLVALLAGLIGLAASLLTRGPGPLLRTEFGQRVFGRFLQATAPKPPDGVVIAKLGEPIPTFELPALDGQRVALPNAYAGRPVLINLWASWCSPCLEEMPELEHFASEQGINGVQVVGIALDDADAVRAFLRRIPVSYPILLDTPGPADAGVRLGNPKGVLPYSVLVSADGRMLRQRIGPFAPGETANWVAD